MYFVVVIYYLVECMFDAKACDLNFFNYRDVHLRCLELFKFHVFELSALTVQRFL